MKLILYKIKKLIKSKMPFLRKIPSLRVDNSDNIASRVMNLVIFDVGYHEEYIGSI